MDCTFGCVEAQDFQSPTWESLGFVWLNLRLILTTRSIILDSQKIGMIKSMLQIRFMVNMRAVNAVGPHKATNPML